MIRVAPQSFFSHRFIDTVSPQLQKHLKPLAVQERLYCKDAPLLTQLRFAIWGKEGLSNKELNEAPRVLHNFILKQNGNKEHISALKAMQQMAAFTNRALPFPFTTGNLYLHQFYKSYSKGAVELRNSFESSGKQMLQEGNPKLAFPLLLQANALYGLITCFTPKTLALRNCLEIAQLCEGRETNFRAWDAVFEDLIKTGKSIKLPPEHIAAMLRNRAACRIFDYCSKRHPTTLSFRFDFVEAAKEYYLEASQLQRHTIDQLSIAALYIIEDMQGNDLAAHTQYVWQEFPYIDIPGTILAFEKNKAPAVSNSTWLRF